MSRRDAYQDAFNMLCGDVIGRGVHRTVYDCPLRPDLVVKVEHKFARFFANVLESRLWTDAEDHAPVARWLAPVEFVSPDARLLLMRRADPVPADYRLPDKVPSFLSDVKRDNFGILDGRLVCIDYALTTPDMSLRLKRAYW